MAVTPSKFSLQSAWSYAAEHPKKAVAVVIALAALSAYAFYLTRPSTPVIQKDPLQGANTPEKLYAVLEAHPELVNRKIDWTFPNDSTLYGATEDPPRPRCVKGVYIAHLLCAGSLANAEPTIQLLIKVLPHMDLTLIDDSTLYSYIDGGSKNNVLKTAIAAASPLPSGSVERHYAVHLILRHMEAEKFPQGMRVEILDAVDNYQDKQTAAELLMRQGHDDYVLRVVKMGARITPRLLIFAAFSMGTTKRGTEVIEELLTRFNGRLTAEEHKNLKEGLIAYSRLILTEKDIQYYEKNFPSLEGVKTDDHLGWVIEAIVRIRKRLLPQLTIEMIAKDKAKIQHVISALNLDWVKIRNMIIQQKGLEFYSPNFLSLDFFSNQYRETEELPKDRRIAFMQDEANLEKVKALLPLADAIQLN
ncbi:MAG: hypothetical protein ABSA17_06385 [Rhabdochlamydiaceae bacterium]